MKPDPIFNFAFINALLRGLPPEVAKEAETFVRLYGFEGLLLSVLQSKEARKQLNRVIKLAIVEGTLNGAQLASTRKAIFAGLQFGARIEVE